MSSEYLQADAEVCRRPTYTQLVVAIAMALPLTPGLKELFAAL